MDICNCRFLLWLSTALAATDLGHLGDGRRRPARRCSGGGGRLAGLRGFADGLHKGHIGAQWRRGRGGGSILERSHGETFELAKHRVVE